MVVATTRVRVSRSSKRVRVAHVVRVNLSPVMVTSWASPVSRLTTTTTTQ